MKVRFETSTEGVEQWLQEWQEQVKSRLPETTRLLAEETMTGVVQSTPVETGRARAGWVSAAEVGQLAVSGGWQGNDAGAMQEGRKAGRGRVKQQETVVQYELENGVKYVPILEYGSRKMSARSIVRRTLQQMLSRVGVILQNLISR